MSKAAKIWLIIAVCLTLIGIAVVALSIALGGSDMFIVKKTDKKTVTVPLTGSFRDIGIDSQTEDIRFVLSDDGSCRVVFEEPETAEFSAVITGDILEIRAGQTDRWYERLVLFNFSDPKITVFLPQAEYGSLNIKESTGDILLPGELSFDGIGITVSTGDIDCASSVRERLRLKTSTGDILVRDLTAGSLDLAVSTGKVEVRSVRCGKAEISVTTGKAVLSEVVCTELTSDGSTGSITLEDVTASGTVSITRSTGDVKFARSDAAELTVETGTGDVSGSLLSPKVFLTKSGTGRIRVPDTASGGTCRITTGTGDISITITEK